MYSLSGSIVTLLTTLYGTTANSEFGYSVFVSDGYIVVGADYYSKLKKTCVKLHTV